MGLYEKYKLLMSGDKPITTTCVYCMEESSAVGVPAIIQAVKDHNLVCEKHPLAKARELLKDLAIVAGNVYHNITGTDLDEFSEDLIEAADNAKEWLRNNGGFDER